MKKLYTAFLLVLLAALLGVGIYSLADQDAAGSASEKREFVKPEFSVRALLDGTYIPALEQYYSDTFPGRETLLNANQTLNKFYYYSGSGEDSVLIVNQTDAAANGGESLDAVQKANGQTAPEAKPPAQEAPAEPPSDSTSVPSDEPQPDETDPAEPAGEEPTEPQPEADPEIDTPDESDASYAGSVVVVGDRAMEIPTRLDDIITSYAAAVGNLAKALGPDVRTISLGTPNGGEFYSPESLHTGEHSQKDMIDFCYSRMDSGIVTVDAYAKLRAHTDEYIYFRTDHHWTQLGAYYAYTAFCEATGFDAVPLEQFQTGRYDTFLGSMYTFTKGYPQSDVLKQHPDYLDYYLPIADTHARYYADGSLENGTPVSVVYTQLDESVSNKYLCFIGGDTPVCIVESDVQGPTCIVLKESYGNAFVPFLTSHYGRIIVIDPREFNQEGKPLDLSVVDVSFISLKIVLPAIQKLLKPTGQVLCLIKPQFEAGKENVGKKGVVRDPAVHADVLQNFLALADSLHFTVRNLTFSPVKGPEGNIEFLAHLSMQPGQAQIPDVAALVAQAHETLKG